jgi:hypothetical protein
MRRLVGRQYSSCAQVCVRLHSHSRLQILVWRDVQNSLLGHLVGYGSISVTKLVNTTLQLISSLEKGTYARRTNRTTLTVYCPLSIWSRLLPEVPYLAGFVSEHFRSRCTMERCHLCTRAAYSRKMPESPLDAAVSPRSNTYFHAILCFSLTYYQ